MNNKIYVLKQRSFMFNDENYHCVIDGSHGAIRYQSNDLAQLKQHWHALEYQYAHDSSWLHISNNENELHTSQTFQQIIQQQNLKITNNQQLYELDNEIYQILSHLDAEILFNILQEIDALIFECVEYTDQTQFYVLCNREDHEYEINDLSIAELDPPQIFLSKSSRLEQLIQDFSILNQLPQTLSGTLQELSDTPLLLQALIQQNPGLSFNENVLQLNNPAIPTVISLNELLKTPLFSYKILDLNEIVHIEQQLNETPNLNQNEE